MNTVLVTGGAGFIASNLIALLIKQKKLKKIYSLDNYSSGSRKNHHKSPKVKYLRGSTLKINSNKHLKKIKFDAVFSFC